jgi:hypothetical protein
MKKSLELLIDGASWSSAPSAFRKSCPFVLSQKEATIDFLGALVWAGITGVSTRLPRWWLASQWAVIRYVAAADHTTRRQSFKRVNLMQGLIAAGAFRVAHLLFPKETDTSEARIVSEPPVTRFETQGTRWAGLVYELIFPLPILLDDKSSVAGCRFRLGAAEGFLEELMTTAVQKPESDVLAQRDLSLRLHTEPDSFQPDGKKLRARAFEKEPIGRYVAIQQSDALIADLELLEGRLPLRTSR